jgi:membrane protein required for colicin V production
MMQWHWVDLVIVLVIGLSVITGIIRGFVKELVALGVWAAAIGLGYYYADLLVPWVSPWIHDPMLSKVAGFIIILFSTILVGGMMNAFLGFLLQRSGLNGTDRVLGMGFGFCRGVFIITLLMVVLKVTALGHDDYRQQSLLYAKFDPLVDRLYHVMPSFIQQVKKIDDKLDLTDPIVPIATS